jgi:hypothetical protein
MARFDARMPVVALQALLLACGSGSHQPEPPAAVPSPAVQPQATPPSPARPELNKQPKKTPRDSGGTEHYPWQSAPIAEQ